MNHAALNGFDVMSAMYHASDSIGKAQFEKGLEVVNPSNICADDTRRNVEAFDFGILRNPGILTKRTSLIRRELKVWLTVVVI